MSVLFLAELFGSACTSSGHWGSNPLLEVVLQDSVMTSEPFPAYTLREELIYQSPLGGFGQVVSIAASSDGGTYIYDSKSPRERRALYRYDNSGKLVRVTGGAGNGPGEYSSLHPILTALSGGGVLIADPSGARAIVYDSQGEVAADLRGRGFGGPRFVADTSNGFWLKQNYRSKESERAVWIRYDSKGIAADTAEIPQWAATPRWYATLFPRIAGTAGFDGRTIAVWTGELRMVRETQNGLVAYVAFLRPIPYDADEHAALQRVMTFELRGKRPPKGVPDSIPGEKPVIREMIGLDWTGNLWFLLSAPSVRDSDGGVVETRLLPPGMSRFDWVEPGRVGSFDPQGKFRGWVTLPLGSEFMEAQGNMLWGTRITGAGDVEVVRWIIVPTP